MLRLLCLVIGFLFSFLSWASSHETQIRFNQYSTSVVYKADYRKPLGNRYFVFLKESISGYDTSSSLVSKKKILNRKIQQKLFLQKHHLLKNKVHYQYLLTSNGFSMTLNSYELDVLARSEDVERIEPVETVAIPESDWSEQKTENDEKSQDYLPLPDVQEVWKKYGIRGENIKIAIVDTGIDYTHPDLGGCLGPTCKVEYGLDLVNNDADPMDDHGHGTHVAGIAAGDGKKQGVASGASLYAFKVLSAEGRGTTDVIIKALELAIDPNQDGDTSDGVDIINMSLGGVGSSKSALSRATDIVTKKALVVCAAGNSGLFQLIGSPAASHRALTVAATDEEGKLAFFSSVGPTEDYKMKPDISAPGVGILSTVPQGKYERYSGTSMASPYVAGVAALLMQYHKIKRPLLVKERLKLTSQRTSSEVVDLLGPFFQEGFGWIKPLDAVEKNIGAYFHSETYFQGRPSGVDMGIQDVSKSDLSRYILLYIQSTSNETIQWNATYQHNLGEKLNLSVFPKNFELKPGEQQKVIVTIQQKIEDIMLSDHYPYANGVVVRFESSSGGHQSISIPMSVYLRAQFNIEVEKGVGLDSLNFISENVRKNAVFHYPIAPSGLRESFYVLPGIYSLLFYGMNYENAYRDDDDILSLYVKEKFSVEKGASLQISSKDFLPQKNFIFKEPLGEQFHPTILDYALKIGNTTRIFGFYYSNPALSMTQIPASWKSAISTHGIQNDTAYYIGEYLSELSDSQTIIVPQKGYAYTDFEFPTLKPSHMCYSFFYRANFGSPLIGSFLPSLSNKLAVAKGSWLDTAYVKSDFWKGFDVQDPVCHGQASYSLTAGFNQEGRMHLFNSLDQKYMALPHPYSVEHKNIYLNGSNHIISKINEWVVRVSDMSFDDGLSTQEAVHYTFKKNSSIVEEGVSDPHKSVRFSLVAGQSYELVRYVGNSIEEASALTKDSFSYPTDSLPWIRSVNFKDHYALIHIEEKTKEIFPDLTFSYRLKNSENSQEWKLLEVERFKDFSEVFITKKPLDSQKEKVYEVRVVFEKNGAQQLLTFNKTF
ncbi:MAG: S8 family serine peptidase [Deltaproteobacteria bacterium]|nr:S8 family serine peptidase [Deltaproteobacteria bacterium]